MGGGHASAGAGGQSGWGPCLSWGWGVRGESASLHTPSSLQRPSLQAVAKHMRVSVCMCVHVGMCTFVCACGHVHICVCMCASV